MNGPRDEFFAGAGFAGDQNRRIAAGDLRHVRQDGGERGRAADNLFEHRGLVDFLSKRDVFLLQSFLGPLAIVDVSTGDIPADDLAVFVTQRVVTGQIPARASVPLAQPQLQLEFRAGQQRTICGSSEPLGIVRMNFRSKASAQPLVEAKAVILERRSVCIQALATRSQLADELWREIQSLPQLCLLFADLVFRPLSVLDVGEDAIPFDNATNLIAQWDATLQMPAILPIRAAETYLVLERFAAGSAREPLCDVSLEIIRMR